ncbi:MAG: DUF3035 domain-containing protein [Alphaproteobacteria bacterium]
MRNKTIQFLFFLSVGAFGLAGCSSVKDQVGLSRSSPDEFMVVKNAPLAMPPDYTLRPPRPGAPRPQDVAASEAARATVFGADSENAGSAQEQDGAENVLLQKAGSGQANPDIRSVVDQETARMKNENQSVANKLLGWGDDEPKGEVINAKEEAERLKEKNIEQNYVDE